MADAGAPALGHPIFVAGHAKSGTTLLAALLDGHPSILAFPEETFLVRQAANHPAYSKTELAAHFWPTVRRKAAAVNDPAVADRWSHDYFDGDFARFEAAFHQALATGRSGHAGVLESLLVAYAAVTGETGRRYWLEKTHGNEAHLSLLTRWYPSLKLIYIVRDPRDVYVSWRRRMQQSGKPAGLETFICRWAMSVAQWEHFRRRDGAAGLQVQYETLLRSPEPILHEICAFLDIPFDLSLTRPTKGGRPWRGNSMHAQAFAGISTAPLGRWRATLPPAERRLIESALWREMGRFGYPIEPPPSPVARLDALRVLLTRAPKRFLKLQTMRIGVKRA